jgi:hypothetical protein
MALYGMALLLLISACSKKDSDIDPGTNENVNGTDSLPQLSAFSPATGAADTLVTITGNYFSNDKTTITVKFGTTLATDIVSASRTEIKVKVPKAALPGKVKLTVTVAGKDAISANDFTIEPPTWKKLFGGDNEDNGVCIVRTADGGYITAGSTLSNSSGDVGVGKGSYDIWVVKTDADGNKVWQKTYGGSSVEQPTAIINTGDGGVLITGYTNSINSGDVGFNQGGDDAWVLKLDANGNLLWQKTYGTTSYDYAQGIISSGDGGYIVAGHTYISTYSDVWIFKLDANGNLLWQKTFGGSSYDYVPAITSTDDGGFIVAANTLSSNTGNVGANNGGLDIWVVKFDANGNLLWQKTLGGSKDEWANHIVRSTDGGFVVMGYTESSNTGDVGANHGKSDLWVVKLNATGTIVWQKTIGGAGSDAAIFGTASADGGFMLSGTTDSNNSGDVGANHGLSDLWIVKVSANGTLAGQLLMGGNDHEFGNEIIPVPYGYVVTGGSSSNNNGDAGANHGKTDMWQLKIKEL